MTLDLKEHAPDQPYGLVPENAPRQWEPDYVGLKLIAAFITLDRLPPLRGPRQPGRHWPHHAIEWADQLAQAELDPEEKQARASLRNRAMLRPTAADIAGMDAAFEWLRDLRRFDSGLALVTTLWALHAARRKSIRKLCLARQWAPHMFYRKRAKALAHLAQWLTDRAVPVF